MPGSYDSLHPSDPGRRDEEFLVDLICEADAPPSLRLAAVDLVRRETLVELIENEALTCLNDRIYLGHALVRLIEEVAAEDAEIQIVWERGAGGIPAIKRIVLYEPKLRRGGRGRSSPPA